MGIASRDAIGIVLGLQLQNAFANLLHHAADVVAKVIGCTLAQVVLKMRELCQSLSGRSKKLAEVFLMIGSFDFLQHALQPRDQLFAGASFDVTSFCKLRHQGTSHLLRINKCS